MDDVLIDAEPLLHFAIDADGRFFNGSWLTLPDVMKTLCDIDLPATAFVERHAFVYITCLVLPQHICRDERGVYIDVLRCRLRLAPRTEEIP